MFVFGGIYITRNLGKSQKTISKEQAEKNLERMIKNISPKKGKPVKSSVEYSDDDTTADELPDIKNNKVGVKATTDLYAEIFCSPEKAGTGTDGWMCDMAEKFNSKGFKVNGKKVSVQIRSVSSGLARDYIKTGKAVPDGFSPSSMFWISMLNSEGIKTETISKSMVKNVAGIVLKNDVYDKIIDKYGSVDMKSITEASESGEIHMGYTNPFTSTAGLNFLACTLKRYDSNSPLSDKAIEGFKKFQDNVPFVALTTVQMRNAADNGSLEGFISEYQTFINDSVLERGYKFTPYGYRHDNPLVALSSTKNEKKEILKKFAEFCSSEEGTQLAKKDGFNQMNDYKCEYSELDGNMLISMQNLYKKNKDNGNPVACVFIADVSGSMRGDRLISLKESLINSMKYVNTDNYIGLVSYNDDVTIELPMAKFNLDQQALFKGSVEKLSAGGDTATFDAICVGLDMLREQCEKTPDAKPMLFVLSDGETNQGYALNDVKDIISGMQIPIYTIGYDADLDALKQISDINEAASINSTTDDIVYQLKQLFNAEM
ncbi:MAG: VWA domain-containing protein [Lachnospiraceae bacterium]|nr:VWA domain-containing protein [Lachnospiraceae bacterium]